MAKMKVDKLVSVITPFYNPPAGFFEASIASVLAQSYPRWELLLVDDGSTNGSSEIARRYAAAYPERIFYLSHPGGGNLGSSAARQLGLSWARGEYIAFLDADDLFLAHKLEDQVGILAARPQLGMLYGMTRYWLGWTGNQEDCRRDFTPWPGVVADHTYQPPILLTLFLQGKAAVPCMGSLLARRDLIRQVGGFEATFTGMYDDQVLYAKLCLAAPVYVSATCWDWYRQHPDSCTKVAEQLGRTEITRRHYLQWLTGYLEQVGCKDRFVWQTLRRELWLLDAPAWCGGEGRLKPYIRCAKKWLLRTGMACK
jgi:glycosyltransferase involved in cell wall biosynthesis